jgi:hypothetical protein
MKTQTLGYSYATGEQHRYSVRLPYIVSNVDEKAYCLNRAKAMVDHEISVLQGIDTFLVA